MSPVFYVRGFLKVVIRPFKLLKRSTVLTLLTVVVIGGFVAYAAYVDRTIYTTEQLVIIPGKVTSDSWLGMESVLVQDISEYSLYQDFTQKNSAYISELGLFSAQESEDAPTTDNPNEVSPDGATEGANPDGGDTDSAPTEETNPDAQPTDTQVPEADGEVTPEPKPTAEPEPANDPEPIAEPVSVNTNSDSPIWGVFAKNTSRYQLAQAIITEEGVSPEADVPADTETTPVADETPATTEAPVTPEETTVVGEEAVAPDENTNDTETASGDIGTTTDSTSESETSPESEPESAPVAEDTSNDYVMAPCLPESGCTSHSMLFTDFSMPDFDGGNVLDSIQLRLSLAAQTKNNRGDGPQRFVVDYTYDTSTSAPKWVTGSVIDIDDEISNSINGGYFLISLDRPNTAGDVANLRIKVSYQGNVKDLETAYVEGLWLEVTSGKFFEEGTGDPYSDEVTYGRDLLAPELNTLDNADLDPALGALPSFTLSYDPQQGFFNRIFRSLFSENTFVVEHIGLTDSSGENIEVPFAIDYHDDKTWTMRAQSMPQKLRPGKYLVTVDMLENDVRYTDTFEFYWGVLAVNTKKSMYFPREDVQLNLAALTDKGDTICNAHLELKIIDPKGAIFEVPVEQSGECGPNNVTDVPDYTAKFTNTGEWGKYIIQLQHKNAAGEVIHKITDSFEVRDYIPFDIERTAPTRIYPPAPYDVKLKVKAYRDFTGDINERVPRGFAIAGLEDAVISTLPEYTLITWKDITMKEGDVRTFSYNFDAPDISPYMYLLGPLDMDGFAELRQWQVASDALNNIGWFTGTRTVASSSLNTGPSPMQWSTSSIDNYYYTHSTSSNSQRVTLRQSGDYLLSVNLPQQRADTNVSRTRASIEVRKNGVAVPEGLGRSGQITGGTGAVHSESSSNVSFLLTGISANDYVEVFVENLTTIDAGDVINITGLASMYIEYLNPTATVFAATTTKTTNSTNLNQVTAFPLEWIETRQDAGFVHSNTVTPQNITISATGTYMVHINVPLVGTAVQSNISGRVLLDGVVVSGGHFQQGYIDGPASESDADSSIHWSGVIVATTTNQVLTVTTAREGNAGTTTVPTGFVGSIMVQKLPSSGVIALRGRDLVGGTNWNTAVASSTRFNTQLAYDSTVFTHSTTTNNHQITVNQSGDYLLNFTDAVTSPTRNLNNRITVTVGSTTVTGAQSKSNFIRSLNGAADASTNLVFLLEGVTAGQIITVNSQQEAAAGTMSTTTDVTLLLWKKAALDFRAPAPSMFATPFDNARFASTTPFFDFQSNDPDGSSDIQYEFAISTSSSFATATVRISGTHAGFTNTASSTDTAPFLENNRIRFQLQPADTLINGNTYYWRVRASDVSGSGQFGDWSTTQSITIDATDVVPNWFQTMSGQFQTNSLFGSVSNSQNNNIKVDSTVSSEILVAYGDSTSPTPKYRLWNGTSWGIEQSAIAVGGTINWVRTAAGVKRDEYIMSTIDQTGAAYAQVYSASTTSWGDRTLLAASVANVARKGIAIGYESVSGDAMAVSCDTTKNPVYRIWNGSTWSATSSITTSVTGVCNFLEIASDPASDEMILVVRDSGAAVGNNYEALVWNGSAWVSNRVLGSVQNAQLLPAGITVRYESSGDQAIVAVTNNTNNNFIYAVWSGTAWSANATQPLTNDFEWGTLSADPNSDRMVLCYIDENSAGGSRIGAVIWDGSIWGTFTNLELLGNSQGGRPVDCEFETTAGRSGTILSTYSDTTNGRYQTYATSSWSAEQTITGIGTATGVFWVQTERAGDGTIVAIVHDDQASGDELESTYWNGTSWSTKQSIAPNPSSIIAVPYETFEMAAKRYQFTQGVVVTQPINFSSVPNQPTWGDITFGSTEPFGTDATVRVKYTSTTTCDTYIPNGALTGNDTGFGAESLPIVLTGLSTSTYSQICLEATLTTFGSASASLDDWSVAWTRKPKLNQNAFRFYGNGSFITPTDPWPLGVIDVLENTALSALEAVNNTDVIRLRMSLQAANVPLSTSTAAFKLQFASGLSCAAATGWSDVGSTSSSTAVWRGYANSIVGSDWLSASWAKRQKVTVKSNLVSGAQTNFPIFVNLADLPTTFFSGVKSDGSDIRVTKADGLSEVPFELVSINTGARTGELHFKGDIGTTTDTDFYVYYGNSGASAYANTATYGRNNVWTNGFEAVYHLDTDPSSTIVDSTSNGRNLTQSGGMNSSNSTSSLMGRGISFDGVDDRLTNSGFTWPNASNTVTVTAWNNVATAQVQNSNLFGFTANGSERFATHGPWSDSVLYWDYGTCCGLPGRISTSYTSYLNKWSHVGLVSQGSGGSFVGIYLDGTAIATSTASDDPNVALTGFALGSTDPTGGSFHRGRIDEFRIASVVRSAGWMTTERNNQSNPTGFFTFASEELIGDGRSLSATLLASSTFAETYEEQNPTANNRFGLTVGQNSEWDFVLQNNGAAVNTNYCFRMVYADGSTLNSYVNYPKLITNAAPLIPTLTAPFDNRQLASTSPYFEFTATDQYGDLVSYEVAVDNDYDFSSPDFTRESNANFSQFTNLATPSERGVYTPGQTIRFIPNVSLTNGVTYWWRVRAKDDAGSNTYGSWSVPKSFTINTATVLTTWFQTTGDQFNTNSLLTAVSSTSTGDVGIAPTFTSGTTTSTVVDYDNRETGNAWGTIAFTQDVSSGAIRHYVEYEASLNFFVLVPDDVLPGNSSGFTSSPISIANLDPAIYNVLRVTSGLTGTPTLPRLQSMTITWSQKIEPPTLLSLFDNAKSASTLPAFTFTTADPQLDDLQYEVQVSTNYSFTSSSTFLSGVDAGFTNVTTPADTNPFNSGNTIRYQTQTALTNGVTYYWRARARDPGGSNSWSNYSRPYSFTIDTATNISVWHQTMGEQFATNDNVGVATTTGGAEVSTVVNGIMVAYGVGTAQAPQYRLWNGTTWGIADSALTVDAQIRWTRLKAAPTRAEYALATQGTDLDVNIQIYNANSDTWGNRLKIFDNATNVNYRTYDIGYETNSGKLIAVACSGTNAVYSIWDGASWSATSTITLGNTNACQWVTLSSDTTSNEIIAVFKHANTSSPDYEALVWNGSSWGNSNRFGDANNNGDDAVALQYEESGNQAVLGLPNGTVNLQWKSWNGSTWSATSSVALSSFIRWANFKRDVGSDRMMLCYIDNNNNASAIPWTGSAWGTFRNLINPSNGNTGLPIDCEFQTTQGVDGDVVIPHSDTTTTYYQSYDTNLASYSGAFTLDAISDSWRLQTVRGGDGTIHVFAFDDGSAPRRYDTSQWNGTSWTVLETLSNNTSITAAPFDGSITAAAQTFPNFTTATIRSTPINFVDGNSPRYERIRFNDTTPGASDIKYRVYYKTATSSYALVPDSALSGNAAGFVNSPISISSLDKNIYGTLKLDAELICSSGICPSIQDWSLEWSEGLTVSGSALEYDQLTNTASGTIAVAVNGVLQVGKTAQIASGTTTQQVVFSTAGTSTFTVPAGVTNVTVKAWGAGGGGGAAVSTGGGGAGAGAGAGFVQANLTTIPAENLSIFVGGGGGGGTTATSTGAGGGGGYSGIFRTSTPLVVAGGGGGGGGGTGKVTYVAPGGACAVTAANCTPTIPAGTAVNDVYIAVLHSRTDTAHTCITNCTGWTEFSTQAGSAGEGRVSTWFYRRTGAVPGNPTFSGPATESYVGRIWAFRGVANTGNPYDVVGTNTAITVATTTFAGSNLSSTVPDAMVVHVGGSMDDNAFGPGSGSCTNPTSAVDGNFFTQNTNGTDNSVFLCYRNNPQSSAGNLGVPIMTQSVNGPDVGRYFTFALKPQSAIVAPIGSGGVGGGLVGLSATTTGSSTGGGGGTQSTGGAIGGGNATVGSAYTGGAGATGIGGGAGGAGGTNGGGTGGTGTTTTTSLPGGGGAGAGYFGGGGGASAIDIYSPGSGGGGGSSYIVPTGVTATSTASGSTTLPGGAADPDYTGGVGVGATAVATTSNGTSGGAGRVVITWTTAAAPGTWAIPNVAAFAGDTVTVFMQNASGTDEAVGVTTYDGAGDITGMQLSKRHLTIGSNDAPTVTNGQLALYANSANEDIFYSAGGGSSINLCAESTCTDARLRVLAGATYAPGADTTAINFQNNGTFAPATSTFRISNVWQDLGVFTPGLSTITFTATSSSFTPQNATSSFVFNNVTFGEVSGGATWNITKPLITLGNLTVSQGTLARSTSTINIAGNLSLGTNGFVTGLSTTTFDGAGSNTWGDAKGSASSTNMGNVVVDGTSKTITLSGNVGTESLTIGGDDTLNSSGSGFNINVVRNWTNNNAFIPQSGTVTFIGTTTGTIARGTSAFNNLTFTGVGGNWSFSTSTLALNGTLTIATGTVTLPTGTTTIGGNFNNSGGTFLHNNGEVRMTSASAGRTITQRATAFLNAFYDLVFAGSGSWSYTESAASTTRNYAIQSGTVTFPSSTLTVGGDFGVTGSGAFVHNSGELILLVQDSNIVRTNGSSLNNLRLKGAAATSWYNDSWSARQPIVINSSQVPTNLTDFPVYVNLANLPAGFFSTVTASGTDIRVTTSDGTTEVPYELVSIDTSAKTGELHFKAPSVSSTTNTTFYIYYGNSGASTYASSSTFGSNNVWTNGYEAVYHLGTNPASIMTDSTRNARSLTSVGGMGSGNSVAGAIGNAIDFDGINDYLQNAGFAWPNASNTVTVTAWNNVSTAETKAANLFGFTEVGGQRLAAHGPWNDAVLYWDFGAAGIPGRVQTSYASYRDKWTHVALTSPGAGGGNMSIYLDGSFITSSTASDPSSTLTGFSLGSLGASNYHDGRIDEFRLASVVRTGGWLATERNNQASSTAFYSVSAAQNRTTRTFTDTNATILGNYVSEIGGDATFPTGILSVGGSFANAAKFVSNNGTVRFNSTSGSETIAAGSSTFATLEFNSGSGIFTVTQNATATVAINLTSASAFTLQSGLTLATLGTFTNAATASSTTWTGSTLSLSGQDGAINAKTHGGDTYATILTDGDTDITMWNSTAATYTTASTSSIYSADHAGVDGNLNIYGDYVRTTGTEYWSAATDFDGTALGSSSRAVSVRVASSSKVGFVSASLNMVGTSTGSSSINSISGAYGLSATNTTITAQFFTASGTDATGFALNASTTLSTFQDGFFTVVPGRTGITISSTTVANNPSAQYQRISFATTTAGAGTNVTMTGTSSAFVWFRLGTGNLYGEAFDAGDGNPGSIRWDDSSNSIVVSGVVYADDGVTPLGSGACDGSTLNVRIVVNSGSYSSSTSCAAGTGAYSFPAVNYIGDPTIIVYLDTNTATGTKGSVVTKTPTTNITNMNIYAGRVITRHQDVAPLSIADMVNFQNSNDSDIQFIATTTGSTTLQVLAPNSLFVFATTTFAPGGNITLLGNASSSAVEGTLQLGAGATFTASGTQTHTLAGRLVMATTSTLTSASSTFIFNASTTGKSITSPNTITFNNLQFTGVGGGWNITAPLTINGNMDVATGTVTGTSNVTINNGSLSGDGTLSFGSGTTTIARTNTFGGTRAWTFADLILGNGSTVGTTTRSGTATTTILGRLTISAAHFLVAGSSGWDLAGSGTVFVESGTLNEDTSTFRYSGASSQVLSTTYYNLDINAGAGTPTYTATGVGIGVTNNLTVGGTATTVFDANTNDPALVVGGSVTVRNNGTFSASNIATTSVGSNFTNLGTFTSNNGLVAMVGSGASSIAPGNSSFGSLLINNAAGTFTVSQNATTTVALNLLSHSNFTLASGTTMNIGGTFTNTLGGGATTFSSSTLNFYGGGTKIINTKTVGDVYGTLTVASGTNVKMWNSSAATYNATGGLYSQDHAAVDGKLNIYGAYTQNSGTDFWSYATDFDGVALAGGSRKVDVAMAAGSSAVYSGGGLEVLGTSSASTTITNQGTGTYGLTISGTASTSWDSVLVRDTNASGIVFSGTPTVNAFSRTDHLVSINGGTGVTVNGSVIDANQAKNFTNNVFASSSGVTGATNVTASGTSISSWRFTNHTGALSGEAYDNDPAGDPGYVVWDDSAALITVSGRVYSDEGTTVSPVCNGVTQNILLRVAGLTTYTASCDASTGAYSISGVAFSPADTLTVYIDNNIRKAVTVSADPVSSISNMDLYENRVIVRHENTSPLSIADMAIWDSSDDGDILFTAVDAGTDTLSLPADQKLLIWNGKTFEPNGNVTLAGGGGGGAQDGTLEAQTNATFRALGTETHSIGGSMIFGTGATFTSGQSTTTFTSTGSGRTIDVNSNPFYNMSVTGSGSFTVTDTNFTTNRSFTQTNGTVTFGSGTTTIGASFNATAGSFTMGGAALVFTSTTTGNIVRFDDSLVPSVRFAGTGGAWSMTDTNATTTGSFTVASGTVTLPSGNLGVGGSFENFTSTLVNNTADIIMSATSSALLRASTSNLFAVRFTGAGPFTMSDVNLTLTDSLTMSTGTLTMATGTVSVGGDFLIASGTVNNASGTVLFNATSLSKNVNFGNNAMYNVVFGSGTGGWTFAGNATTTNNFSITGASSFTKSANTNLNVGGVFTNTVGGSNTTWSTTTLRLYGPAGYTINTKTTGGDVYGTLQIDSSIAVRAWNSSAATTTVVSNGSLYSQDHAAVDGALNIYGNFAIATTTEYWNYSNDFDGTVLAGAAQRQVNVRLASNATTTLTTGTLQILGTAATSTTIAALSGGTYGLVVTGGTLNAQYYTMTNLGAMGLTMSGAPTITNLANGAYTLTVSGGTLITVDASVLDANASKIFASVGFATTSAITGNNVTLTGSTSNAWRFSSSYGNLSGEAYDVDGLTACGAIRFDNSGCLLTQQTHYRWRNDDGGEGVPNSEWFNSGFDFRQRVRVVNSDTNSYASTAVKIIVPYDSSMQSDFDDLRFTSGDGLTQIPFWIERYTASTDATVWVRVPNLPASETATVFMYYGSSTVGSLSNGSVTFDAFDDFEDNNITEYSGDTSLFQTDTTPVYGGTYALEALNKSGRTTDGIYRTAMTVSQGQIIRWMQYLNTTTGSGDDACTLFGVQSPGANNNNYAVCLEQFGTDRMVIAKNIYDNDSGGTVLASTTATFATGWYEVEVDWRTNNSMTAYLRNTAGTLIATASTTDSSYTTGGIGFTFWFQNGSWDSYTARPRAMIAPTVYFGAEQTDGGATWEKAQNVAGSGVTGTTKRLRFAIENSGLNITNQTFRLEYAQKGAAPSCEAVGNASYTAVPNQASCGSSPICMQTSSNVADSDPSTDLLASTSGAFASGKIIESPSNITASLNVNQNTYTELEYVLTPTINATSSYCMRVTNGGTPLDFYNKVAELNLQFDPVFGPVSLNYGNPILLTPGTTTTIYATGTVTDLNGYADLVAGSSTIYRSGVGPSCTANTNNCYKAETTASSSCSFINCAGNTCTLSCRADIYFNAEATDATPYAGEEWLAYLEVRDSSGSYDFESAIGVELLTLRAASVNNAINYGSLAVADNTGTFNPTTTVSNVGNVAFNIELLGTDLSDGGSSRIPADQQKYATSTFTYSSCVSCGVISSTTPTTLALGLAKPTVPNPPVTASVYWGIAVPVGVNSAPHSGINVFTPVSP